MSSACIGPVTSSSAPNAVSSGTRTWASWAHASRHSGAPGRQQYYEALQCVREQGDLDQWLKLFLDGVKTQAIDAVARAERLTDLRDQCRATVQASTRGIANQVVEIALERPVLTARVVEARIEVSRPAAIKALRQLSELGILAEATGGPRGQNRWRVQEVLSVLTEET